MASNIRMNRVPFCFGILLFAATLSPTFCYTSNQTFAIRDANGSDTLALFYKGVRIYENQPIYSDSTRSFFIMCRVNQKDVQIIRAQKALRPDSVTAVTHKMPLYADSALTQCIGYAYPNSASICALSISRKGDICCSYSIPASYISFLGFLRTRDWHQYLIKSIKQATLLNRTYQDVRKELDGVFCFYPQDSTWNRGGFIYCELYGRCPSGDGEISAVIVVSKGVVAYIWFGHLVDSVRHIKLNPGYLYYGNNAIIPPHSVIETLENSIVSGKGIGSPSVETHWDF